MPEVVFDRIKQGRLAEIIAAQIRGEIRSGALALGDHLPPERELIEQLGVSRATVREALMLLEADGFIQVRAGRHGGAYVTSPKIERLATILDVTLEVEQTTTEQLLEARSLMEPLAVRLATARATESDFDRIQASIQRAEEHVGSSDIFAEEAARFHVLVAESTHNGVISALTATTQQLIYSRAAAAFGTEPASTLRAHRRILDAMRARDPEAAVRRMVRHVDAFRGVLDAPRSIELGAEG